MCRRLRELQKKYFSTRSSDDLALAKMYELKLDEFITKIDREKYESGTLF